MLVALSNAATERKTYYNKRRHGKVKAFKNFAGLESGRDAVLWLNIEKFSCNQHKHVYYNVFYKEKIIIARRL